MYDIAIVGAGPAGATLGRLLGGQYRVLMLDRRPLDIERPCAPPGDMTVRGDLGPTKCCGGLLAPDAQRMLACLGLSLPEHVIGGPQIFAVRATDLQTGRQRFYQRNYINIDREKFDRHLVSMLDRSTDLRCLCTVRRLETCGQSTTIHFDCGGASYVEQARVVVGADGAGSAVRRALPVARPRRYVAIQEWFQTSVPPPYYGAVFDDRITDFYSWTIPKGDFLIVGSTLAPGKDASARFQRLKDGLTRLGMDLGRCVRREGGMILRPRHPGDICSGAGNVALVGEAAGFVSPSSAEGISYALASARALADALLPGLEGFAARYRRLTAGLRRSVWLKSLKCPLIYNTWPRNVLMSTGLASLDVTGQGVESDPGRMRHLAAALLRGLTVRDPADVL